MYYQLGNIAIGSNTLRTDLPEGNIFITPRGSTEQLYNNELGFASNIEIGTFNYSQTIPNKFNIGLGTFGKILGGDNFLFGKSFYQNNSIGSNNLFFLTHNSSNFIDNDFLNSSTLGNLLLIDTRNDVVQEKRSIFLIGDFNKRKFRFNVNAGEESALEINASQPNLSGLRFLQLNSDSPAEASNGKVLSLNNQGDVVLVEDGGSGSGSITNTITNNWNNTLTSNVNGVQSTTPIITNFQQNIVGNNLQTSISVTQSTPLPTGSNTNSTIVQAGANTTVASATTGTTTTYTVNANDNQQLSYNQANNSITITNGNTISLPAATTGSTIHDVYTIGSYDTPAAIRVSTTSPQSSILLANGSDIGSAINAAISAGFKKIYIQEGTYTLSNSVNMNSLVGFTGIQTFANDVTIEGSGNGTKINVYTTTAFDCGEAANQINTKFTERAKIKNLHISLTEVHQVAFRIGGGFQRSVIDNINIYASSQLNAHAIKVDLGALEADYNTFSNIYINVVSLSKYSKKHFDL